jgi:hypothetical protein
VTADDPLAGLARVPWARLHGCRGFSERVPEWLRMLRHGSDEAYGQLFDHVSHQGTRWQVSAAVVPFLVGLVDDRRTPGRARLLALLAAVAVGDRRDDVLPFDAVKAYPEGHGLTGEQEARLVSWLEEENEPGGEDGDDFLWNMAGPDTWALRAYRAAEERADTLATWVSDDDPDVASRAAALLVWFPATAESVEALLNARTASANLALAHLEGDDRRLLDMLADDDERVALTAAVALAYRRGPATPEPALTMLAVAADQGKVLPADVPGWDRALRGFVSKAVARIGW